MPESSERDSEGLGIGFVIFSFVALIILNVTWGIVVPTENSPPGTKLSGLAFSLAILGVLGILGVCDFVLGGIHCCLFSLPMALSSYAVVLLNLVCALLLPPPLLPHWLRAGFLLTIVLCFVGHIFLFRDAPEPRANECK